MFVSQKVWDEKSNITDVRISAIDIGSLNLIQVPLCCSLGQVYVGYASTNTCFC